MKTNKKLIGFVIGTVVMFAGLWLYSQRNAKKFVKPNPEFGAYISGFTSGTISSESYIRIRFTNPVEGIKKFNENIDEKLFSFSPSIKGQTVWTDNQTLEFRPSEPLPQNTFYDATFKLGDVLKVKDDLEKFPFQFKTIEQSFDITVEGVKTYDKHVLKWERVVGAMQTADAMNADQSEKVLEAYQDNRKLKISWIHETDRKSHTFQVDSVIRGDKESVVKLIWNGSKINVDKKGEIPVLIPSLSDFILTDSRVVQSPEQYLLLQFSDPLLESQNIDGLIHLGGNPVARCLIEDNEIRVYPDTRLDGEVEVTIDAGIKNIMGYGMKKAASAAYTDKTDHLIPAQIDHLFSWRRF